MSDLTLEKINDRLITVENKVNILPSSVTSTGVQPPTGTGTGPGTGSMGGFFGGSDYSFAPAETTTKLYTGPILGGKGKKTRRHKNKRHSYSRKSKKGLKNKFKRMFGFKGGQVEVSDPTLSVKPQLDSLGGTTNVKSPL